ASPSSVAYGTQALFFSRQILVRITNTGTGTLAVGAGTIAGPSATEFTRNMSTCTSANLASGAACSILVTFRPTSEGAKTATLEVALSPGGSPLRVPLSGVGLSSQNRIMGRVTDGFTALPIPNATINVYNSAGTAIVASPTTDAFGAYFTSALPDGVYRAKS